MPFKKMFCWLLVISFLMLVAGGCMAPRRPVPTPYNDPNKPNTPGTPSTPSAPTDPKSNAVNPLPSPATPTPAPNPNLTPGANDRTKADEIQKSVNSVPDVTKSYVVVVGNVALIGLDINESRRSAADENFKKNISSMVTKQQTTIAHVYVTADPNLVTRVRRLSESVAQGKPIAGLMTEIMDIMRLVMPTSNR